MKSNHITILLQTKKLFKKKRVEAPDFRCYGGLKEVFLELLPIWRQYIHTGRTLETDDGKVGGGKLNSLEDKMSYHTIT